MNGIIDTYDFYFNNLTSFHFDYYKKKNHNCLVCADQLTDENYLICSREKTEKFIVNYLEHLKIFGYSIKCADIFISSIRNNGILSSNVKGFWKLKKDNIHEVMVIEHVLTEVENN